MTTPPSAPTTAEVSFRLDDGAPVLMLPERSDFTELREQLRAAVPGFQDRINGRPVRLDVGAREIKLFDIRRIVNLLREEFTVDVSGLYVRPEAVHQYAERELKLRLHLVSAPAEVAPEPEPVVDAAPVVAPEALPAPEPETPPSPATPEEVGTIVIPKPELPPPEIRGTSEGRRTMAIQRTLRSGTRIQFDGDVTIWGDVNPGAQIVAHGNVLVLGALRGMVHAGAAGDEASFVLAFQLQPTQLRIGRRIAMLPDRSDPGAAFSPELARVVDGNVQIERFTGRVPR